MIWGGEGRGGEDRAGQGRAGESIWGFIKNATSVNEYEKVRE